MNLVIDTNIVFSTLLNPNSVVGEVLMNVQDTFTFYAPELLKDELKRYALKISTFSKLTSQQLDEVKELLFTNIIFVSEELISEQSWVEAFQLIQDIDEDDTPFVALSIELNAKLWTGDKILSKGLVEKGVHITIPTSDIRKLLNQ